MITGQDIDKITSSHEEALKINQAIDIIGYFENLTKSQIADLLVKWNIKLDDSLNYNFSPSSSWYRYVINLRRKSNHLEKAKSLELEQIMKFLWITYEKCKLLWKNFYEITQNDVEIIFFYNEELDRYFIYLYKDLGIFTDNQIKEIREYFDLIFVFTWLIFLIDDKWNISFKNIWKIKPITYSNFASFIYWNLDILEKYLYWIRQIIDFWKTAEDAFSFITKYSE